MKEFVSRTFIIWIFWWNLWFRALASFWLILLSTASNLSRNSPRSDLVWALKNSSNASLVIYWLCAMIESTVDKRWLLLNLECKGRTWNVSEHDVRRTVGILTHIYRHCRTGRREYDIWYFVKARTHNMFYVLLQLFPAWNQLLTTITRVREVASYYSSVLVQIQESNLMRYKRESKCRGICYRIDNSSTRIVCY